MDFDNTRRLLKDEERLLRLLIKNASTAIPVDWSDRLLVSPMDDGGMGSLILFPNGHIINERAFGKQVSEYIFTDEDGVDVVVSLNVDENNNLFELDIWKTDFNPLIKIPEILE